MTNEELKSAIRRWYDKPNDESDDYRVPDELFTEDIVYESSGAPTLHGREAVKEFRRGLRRAFPDGLSSVEDIFIAGNKLVVRGYHLGTNTGEFMGLPPNGKHVRAPYIELWEVRNGKLAHVWSVTDLVTMLRQMGTTYLPQPMEERMPA